MYANIIVYTRKDRDPFQGENALLIIIIFTSVGPPLKKKSCMLSSLLSNVQVVLYDLIKVVHAQIKRKDIHLQCKFYYKNSLRVN